MEIKTTKEIIECYGGTIMPKDTLYRKQKWIAVDDLRDMIFEKFFDISHCGHTQIEIKDGKPQTYKNIKLKDTKCYLCDKMREVKHLIYYSLYPKESPNCLQDKKE